MSASSLRHPASNAPTARSAPSKAVAPANLKRRTLLICVFLAVTTQVVFLPLVRYDFINYDDKAYVSENVQVQNGLSLKGLLWALSTNCAANWHPLTWVSHMLDCQLFGLKAGGHHFTNVLLHVASTVLLFLVMRRITQTLWRSALVAALFALHPVHVESVAWVSERKDVLSTLFLMLTLWTYAKYVERREEGGERRAKGANIQHPTSNIQKGVTAGEATGMEHHASRRFYFLSLGFFALGLMSKPMLVTLPFVLLLLDYWPLRRLRIADKGSTLKSCLGLVREKLPFFALSIASSVVTFWVQRSAGAMPSLERLTVPERLANALISYCRYAGKMFWPAKLSIFYPHPGAWPIWQIAGAALLLCCMTLWAVWLWRSRPYVIVGWLWFLGTLFPVIGIVQVGSQSMADRYAYVSYLGLFVIVAWGINDLLAKTSYRPAISVALSTASLAACVALTSIHVRYWKNTETLFSHAIEVTTHNLTAQLCLGGALADDGKLPEGMMHLEEALRLDPKFADAHGRLGYILAGQGKFSEAVEHYRQALENKPDLPEALNNLAWMLATHPDPKFRDGQEAVRLAERAVKLTNSQKTIYIGTLAAAYAEASRFQDAIATAQKARAHALTWNEKDLAEKNRQLVELYQAKKPYRE